MKFLKKLIFFIAMAASVIAILYGIYKVLEPDRSGFTYIGVGAAAIVIISILKKKLENIDFKSNYKATTRSNKCDSCGASMVGAQYKYSWNPYSFDLFISDDNTDNLEVAVNAFCPKCGSEKKFQLFIDVPNLIEMHKTNFKKRTYVERKIREQLDYLFKN